MRTTTLREHAGPRANTVEARLNRLLSIPDDDSNDTAACWRVYRQDDNGNVFPVASGLCRAQAQSLVAHYERLGHKQHYWMTR